MLASNKPYDLNDVHTEVIVLSHLLRTFGDITWELDYSSVEDMREPVERAVSLIKVAMERCEALVERIDKDFSHIRG